MDLMIDWMHKECGTVGICKGLVYVNKERVEFTCFCDVCRKDYKVIEL
jgi:hypothetical protein